MVRAALKGELDDVEYRLDPVFGLRVPTVCPGVPPEILDPRQTWQNKGAYDEQARKLKAMWDEQIKKI